MNLRALTATALATLLLGAGCTSHPKPVAEPTPTPTLSPAQSLAALAAKALPSSYVASYTTVGKDKRRAITTVYVSPQRYRVDIVTGAVTGILYGGVRTASISCRLAPKKAPRCFIAAKAGKALPALLDPGVQRVFTDDLAVFAARPDAFTVAEIAPRLGTGSVPAARCFSVSKTAPAPKPVDARVARVEAGTWCLSDNGVPVALVFSSGTLTMRALGGAPTAKVFTPAASPSPLP